MSSRMKKWQKLFVLLVIIVVVIIALHLYIILPQEKEIRYLSIEEFWDKYHQTYPPHVGEIYYIQDKVLSVKTIKIPNTTASTLGEVSINPDEIITFTEVVFESNTSNQMSFIGNRTTDFLINTTVRFSLQVKEYNIPYTGKAPCVEDIYAKGVISAYSWEIIQGRFSPITFEKIFSENYTRCNLTIINVAQNLLPSLHWSDINVSWGGNANNLSLPETSIYTSAGEFIGTIGKTKDIQNDQLVAVGQYLEFTYLEEYNSTKIMFFPSYEVQDPVYLPILCVIPLP